MIKRKNSSKMVGDSFKNSVPTSLSVKGGEGFFSILHKRFLNRSVLSPRKPLKNVVFKKDVFNSLSEGFVWFGHSSILMRLDGKNILVDPVFSRASPFLFVGPKPFPMVHPLCVDDIPKIDVVLITHDHYDHLEKRTIKKLGDKVIFCVPLRVKKILVGWGISENKIIEFDWYQKKMFFGISITFTPSRHFSGRSLFNRNSTLWGGWIIKSNKRNVYVSGDGGYFSEFKKIGVEHGPFDLAFIECGQYNLAWKDIHMIPEESVKAGIDCKAKFVFPVHWGKYCLSVHSWIDPIEYFLKESEKKKVSAVTSMIGEVFTLDKIPKNSWWKE